MSVVKAVLLLDPDRREDQLEFIRAKSVQILRESGNQLWAAVTEQQAAELAAQGIYVQFQEHAAIIELPAVVFDPSEPVPVPPPELAASEPAGDHTAYYVVQFVLAPDPAWIESLEDLGGAYVQDLPVHAAVFRFTSQQAAALARQDTGLPFVSWAGIYHPAYALSHYLAGRDEPFSAAGLAGLHVDASRVVAQPSGTLDVFLFQDTPTAEARPAVEAAGATVRSDTGYSLIVDIPAARVPDLLRVPGIQAVEPHAETELDNQRSGLILAANEIRHLGNVDFLVNLDGTGEIVGVLDTGLDNGAAPVAHTDFNNPAGPGSRVLQIANLNAAAFPTQDLTPHGTHVAGSIASDGRNAPPPNAVNPNNTVPRGIAPRCQIVFHSLYAAAAPVVGAPPLSTANSITGFRNAYAAGARVHTNSWGSVPALANAYTNTSGAIDRFAFLQPDALVLFSSGNREADLNNDGVLDMNRLSQEGVAKNILCIGASENQTNLDGLNPNYRSLPGGAPPFANRYNRPEFNATAGVAAPFSISDNANDVALFSNRGRVRNVPAPARRRIRPDLVAPGTNVISTGPGAMLPFAPGTPRRPATAPPAFYFVTSGTSMATPLAAGAALLTRQFYRTRFTQLRRPQLLEQLPAAPVDLPAASAASGGCALAWVHPDAAAGPNHVVAARYGRQLVRVTGIVQLAANVGAHPAPALGQHGDNTLLVYRDSAGTLRLSLHDRLLARVAGFGAAGVVALAPASRAEDDRRPALGVYQDEVAVAWVQTGTDNLVFQRFRAATGAPIDPAPKTLGTATNTSAHSYLLHNGARWAAVWVHFDGTNYRVRLRFIANNGTPEGAQPFTLLTQARPVRQAHLVWDARQSRFLVVWVAENPPAGNSICSQRVMANGAADGAAAAVVTVPVANQVRHPRLAAHPDSGFALVWEDNSQTPSAGMAASHDVYLAFLNAAGLADGRIPANRLRLSDTPHDTSGFSVVADAAGFLPLWQSNDEINSDLLGVYALNVTPGGSFQAQADPNTPLLQNGHYVRHKLVEHTGADQNAVAMVWAGGDYYLLRSGPSGLAAELYLVRTNADGKPDTAFGGGGERRIDSWISYTTLCLDWTGSRLIAGSSFGIDSRVYLVEADGRPVLTFGRQGTLILDEIPAGQVPLQVAHQGAGAAFRIFIAYSRIAGAAPHTIRYTVVNAAGAATGPNTVPPRDLATADGTARQGWFHLVASDAPVHLIAAWHVTVGANMAVQLNRFRLNGQRQLSAVGAPVPDITLTALPGDSQNAVLAPRPVLFDPPFPTPAGALAGTRRREYGAAWQYRPAAAAPWEIRFSRLTRDARVAAVRDIQVFQSAAFHGLDPQLVWHTNGYGLAWIEQPVAGGTRRLFFTVLDQDGARVNLAPAGAPVAQPAPDYQISADAADVKTFHLVWNGRTFRIAWTEVEGGMLRLVQSALAVPRPAGGARYDDPFQQPSSALLRATLINGATNIRNTALPNVPATVLANHNPNDGYGWGRINLRQALAPAPPVTFHVRDDCAVGDGGRVRYEFSLPPGTMFLRITLAWTDPPGNDLVNHLHLRVTTPAFPAGGVRTYVGNRWQTLPGNPALSDPLPAVPPVNPFQDVHPVEQVVIAGPPELPAGIYTVEVLGRVPSSAFQQFQAQPFALVFVGSGRELRTGPIAAAGPLPVY